MSDETREEDVELRLRRHLAEHDRVSPLAADSAKALFGLRRIDDELLELVEQSAAMRGEEASDLARFERGDVVMVVRWRDRDAEVVVQPPSTPVAIETAAGSTPLDTADGVGVVSATGPVRFRLWLPDGTSCVTDGIDLTPR